MFRKEEKKALTRLAVLSVGWGLGLDRFYEGKNKEGFLSLIGWGIIFSSLLYLSPCHGYDYTEGVKTYAQAEPNKLIVIPLIVGLYGVILVIKKGFRLLRSFESAE